MREVVIVSAVRTAVGKAYKGTLRATRPDDLGAVAIAIPGGRSVAFRGKADRVDNADDGTREQFQLVHEEMSRLSVPWHAIPGDHDFKQKSLDNFYRGLNVQKLPYVVEISGCRCIFLDVVSRGTGGPDFRLGAARIVWLRS